MSLRTFLTRPEVKQLYRDCFPEMPYQPPMPPIVAPPRTNNWSEVGTACDYLMRFYARHLNPAAAAREWIAMKGVSKLRRLGADRALLDRSRHRILAALKAEAAIMKSGEVLAEHAAAALALAPLDAIVRGRYDPARLVKPAADDVEDLLAMVELMKHQDWLVATRACALNPNFGDASVAIGGADCDLVIDGMIVDIKATIDGGIRRQDLHQVLGYWALSTMCPVLGPIDTIGIYNARHGVLTSVRIDDVTSTADLKRFLQAFADLVGS